MTDTRITFDSTIDHDLPLAQRREAAQRWIGSTMDPALAGLEGASGVAAVEHGRKANVANAVVALDGGRRLLVELVDLPFAQQEQVLVHMFQRLKGVSSIAWDATGIGRAPAEHARERLGDRVVLDLKGHNFRELAAGLG